jgi:toxin YhaV
VKKTPVDEPALIVNGWTVYAHALCLNQIAFLTVQVEKLKARHPRSFHQKNAAKRLAAIEQLMFKIIPQDPTRTQYRQGMALGDEYKHWCRAKFFQQYRLFFRYHHASQIIVYGWVNDEHTKRAYESNSDAYLIFRRMLKNGAPPDNWEMLLKEVKASNEYNYP